MASKKTKKTTPKASTKNVGRNAPGRSARKKGDSRAETKAPTKAKPAKPLPSAAHAPPPPPPKAPPPPKTERRGRTTKVTFEDMGQVNYFAAKGMEGSFALNAREILAREEEVKRLLDALKVHRGQLDGFTKDRDATKAKLDATPDGQRLTGLKESVKNSETIVAALQKKLEVAAWEVTHGRTYDAQRELFDTIDLDSAIRDKPRTAAERTGSLPLEETPRPAASPEPPTAAPEPPAPPEPTLPALPPVTSAVIDGEFEDAPVPFAAEALALLRQHGPLSIEQLCALLGWEERDSGNWQKLQVALRSLSAVKQSDGRWYLTEHLRALPAHEEPTAPVLALGPAPSLRDQLLFAVGQQPGVSREEIVGRFGNEPDATRDTLEQLLEQGALVEEEGKLLAVGPTPSPSWEATRRAVLEVVEQAPRTQAGLLDALCPPHEGEAVRDAVRALVASQTLVLNEDETYTLGASAALQAPSPAPALEASAAQAPTSTPEPSSAPSRQADSLGAPLPPPEPSTSGHPQRVLRSWLWARLSQTAGLSVEQLGAEAVAFHREYLSGTLALLDASELVMERKGLWLALEDGENGVDRVVLDRTAAALIDAPLDCNELAKAMSTPTAIVWDVLEELREQGRVTRKGKAWSLTHGAKGAAE